MTHYRCYLFNADNNIVSVDTIQSDLGEAGALDKARAMMTTTYRDAHAVEIWDRAILVGRIENKTNPTFSIESLLRPDVT